MEGDTSEISSSTTECQYRRSPTCAVVEAEWRVNSNGCEKRPNFICANKSPVHEGGWRILLGDNTCRGRSCSSAPESVRAQLKVQVDSAQLTVYNWQCTVDSVRLTVHSWQCTVDCAVDRAQLTVHSWQLQLTVHSWQFTADSAQLTVYSWQCTVDSVHTELTIEQNSICAWPAGPSLPCQCSSVVMPPVV